MDLGNFFSSASTHNLWLLAGLFGLILGMMVGEPVIMAVGLSAIITAIAAISVPAVSLQLIIWSVLSVCLALLMRAMVPGEAKDLKPRLNGEVMREIRPGQIGEVAYEGSLWKARCQISDLAIAPGQEVEVVGRQGNTLIVLPTTFY
ncbi:MAG: NfeD family protein [Synechococcales bacterium]|nr:NfeD family protein [Synechococcales bacterium]